jgi:AraC-like DNA-binding protein
MLYIEYKPVKQLSNYIQLIWIAESESDDDFFPRQKILPDGIIEIVFHFKEPFLTFTANRERIKQPEGFAVSQMKKFIEIESNGRIGLVSVRFYPWGAYHFFKTPIYNFLDNMIDIKKLWPNDFKTILTNIKNLDNDKKVDFIQLFLLKCLKQHKKETATIDNILKLIRISKGVYLIEELCQKFNYNYKQLERKFLSTVGTTPKVFSKTTRFLNLCHHLKDYENYTMAQLSYELGYYDQAHFIKEFKTFSGLTPKEYYKQNNVCFTKF